MPRHHRGATLRGDLNGTAGTARWVFGITVADGALQTCDQVIPAGGPEIGAASFATPDFEARTESPVALVPGSTSGTGDGSTYAFVAGDVAEEVTEVQVAAEGLDPAVADIAEAGPLPGRRWFAAVLDVTPLGLREVTGTVVARRADGSEVARTTL